MKVKIIATVEESDLIGSLKGFPIEIVQKMVDLQIEQGNPPNVNIFQHNNCEILEEGGFSWRTNDMEVENQFWCEVIYKKNFGLFFTKYPKK